MVITKRQVSKHFRCV